MPPLTQITPSRIGPPPWFIEAALGDDRKEYGPFETFDQAEATVYNILKWIDANGELPEHMDDQPPGDHPGLLPMI